MQGRHFAVALIMLATGFGGGIALERLYLMPAGQPDQGGKKILYWVAPMDPNFRRDGPGKSPMGMDLVPVYEGAETATAPGEVDLSPVEINAIGVRTTVARVEELVPRIETVGFVGFNEHLTSHIHLRTEGWIEHLPVRAVGDQVRTGDLLFEVYAPEISIAVSELRRGLRRNSDMEITAAAGKLRNYGMSERQLAGYRRDPQASDRLRVYAPQDGVVVALAASEGMYLKPETEAMTLTDLSSVWLVVDVFERDLGRLDPDMRAEARVDHLPERTFTGTIDYINPVLDGKTRTLPVRIQFDNRDGLLRPNMFAEVTLQGAEGRRAITVPAEAVIRTGRAERVVLAFPEGRFKPRLVTTGLKERGRIEIVQGLAAGERVVASAQFLIDSESSLTAGFLRMAPTDADPAIGQGVLVSLAPDDRQATIRHAAIAALDWPAMTTRFALAAGVPSQADAGKLEAGTDVRFTLTRGADGQLALLSLGPDNGVDAVGTGRIHAVMADEGKVSLSHDPIPALGWPGMTMDLPIGPAVDPDAIPLETPVAFDLSKGEGAMYVITAVRPQPGHDRTGEEADAQAGAANEPDQPPIEVGGVIDAVDAQARTATISHDDILEIGMPGMTMDFPLAKGLDPADLPVGKRVRLHLVRKGPMQLVLAEATPEATAMAASIEVGGIINAVDAVARTANVSHDDILAIGMPGMTMDFPLAAGVDPAALPVGQRVLLGLHQADGMRLELLWARSETES